MQGIILDIAVANSIINITLILFSICQCFLGGIRRIIRLKGIDKARIINELHIFCRIRLKALHFAAVACVALAAEIERR